MMQHWPVASGAVTVAATGEVRPGDAAINGSVLARPGCGCRSDQLSVAVKAKEKYHNKLINDIIRLSRIAKDVVVP